MAEVYVTERAKDALEDLESDIHTAGHKKLNTLVVCSGEYRRESQKHPLDCSRTCVRQYQSRIKKKLREIRDWPDHYLKPLSGRGDYSLRIGDYRALIEWGRDEYVLFVKSVDHRRNFYDREL